MKKYILVFLVLALVFSMSYAAAESVNIDGTNFNIPAGYKADNDVNLHLIISIHIPTNITNDLNLNNLETYTDGENLAAIVVVKTDESNFNDSINYLKNDTEKTIAGKTGYLSDEINLNQTNTNFKKMVLFKYYENGKFYMIAGPDEATIESIIK